MRGCDNNTGNLFQVLKNVIVLGAMTSLAAAALLITGCRESGNGSSADQAAQTPTQVVEAFYDSVNNGDCSQAIQYLFFDDDYLAPEIEVFIKAGASEGDIEKLSDEIQAMLEVAAVHYVSKEEALQRLRDSLQGNEDVLAGLQGNNPLPSSFEITLKAKSNVEELASRFFDNPIVDNTPGSDPPDGVNYTSNQAITDIVEQGCHDANTYAGYQIEDMKVSEERVDNEDASVLLEATVYLNGTENNRDKIALELVKVDGEWRIDYFKTVSDGEEVPVAYSLLMVKNPVS